MRLDLAPAEDLRMATVVKVSCPTCGVQQLPPARVRLVLEGPSYFYFVCPVCALKIRKPADDKVVALLRSVECVIDTVAGEVPAEALEPRSGPRLNYDDLLDLMSELDDLPCTEDTDD